MAQSGHGDGGTTISGEGHRLTPDDSLFGRRKRNVRYDARYADGHIERDVNTDDLLNGRQLPADAWATRDAADAAGPQVGTGPWVQYATGRVLSD